MERSLTVGAAFNEQKSDLQYAKNRWNKIKDLIKSVTIQKIA